MQNNNQNEKQLIPLRQFAKRGPYSPAYLSLLVQRGKLKAKKIGRNYYTTQEWFNEYFEIYARDEKRASYNKLVNKQVKAAKYKELYRLHALKIMVVSIVIFIIIILSSMLYTSLESAPGRVAGESEQAEISTSTIILDNSN